MADKKKAESTLMKERTVDELLGELTKFQLPTTLPDEIEKTPTGVLSLDVALHGGLPKGKGIMIFGDKSSGKTTMSMFIAREVLNQGKTVAWLDIENSFDPAYAEMMNFDYQEYINKKKFMYFDFSEKTSVAERWLDAITMMISSGKVDLIVMDSLAAVPTNTEMNSSAEKANVATLSRILTPWVRVIIPLLKKYGTTLLIINQERVVIGSAVPVPNTFPGGKAIGHFMSIIIQMRSPRLEYNKSGAIGKMTMRYLIRKTKVFRPPKANEEFYTTVNFSDDSCELDFVGEVMIAAVNYGILRDKNGERWTKNVGFFQGTQLGNGEKQIKEKLEADEDILNKVAEQVFISIREGKSYDAGSDSGEETELQGAGVYEGEDDLGSDNPS